MYEEKIHPDAMYYQRHLLGEGQKEYCVECLKSGDTELFAIWLINNRYAILKPAGQCSHK